MSLKRKDGSAGPASSHRIVANTCDASNGARHRERPDPSSEPIYQKTYRAVKRLVLRTQKPWIARRMRRETTEDVDGVRLVIPPGVHNPIVFRAGVFLARTVDNLPSGPNLDVLDMGTGSGISAIYAARRGFSVSAVDVNPAAAACARANVIRNHVEEHVTVHDGDLFEPVTGRQFDLILFNPPFFVGTPQNAADMAWRSVDILDRFARDLPTFLRDDAQALIVFSSDGDENALHKAFSFAHCHLTVHDWIDFGNEVLTVYSATKASHE